MVQTSARDLRIFRFAALFTVATIALGSLVCATDSSSACPAWPICYAGQVGPQVQAGWLENPAIEFIHRMISFLCLVFLGWAGWVGRRYADRRLRVFPWVALAGAIGSAVFGMMIVLFALPLALGLLDLGLALVAMSLIVIALQAASGRTQPGGVPRVRAGAGAALGVLLVMHLLGSLVAGRAGDGFGSFTRCLSWPLWQVLAVDNHPGLQLVRVGLAALATVLIVLVVAYSLSSTARRTPAVMLGVLLVVELSLGAIIRSQGLTAGQTNGINSTLAVVYALSAVGILWSLASLLGRAMAFDDSGSRPRHTPQVRTGV